MKSPGKYCQTHHDVEDKRKYQEGYQETETPTLRFAHDIAKNDIADAHYKVKLRQQYQTNMGAFAEKEKEKEKANGKESATEHVWHYLKPEVSDPPLSHPNNLKMKKRYFELPPR